MMKLTKQISIFTLSTVLLIGGVSQSYGQIRAIRNGLNSASKVIKNIGKSSKIIEKSTKTVNSSKIKVIKKNGKEFITNGNDVFELIPCPVCYGRKTIVKNGVTYKCTKCLGTGKALRKPN